MIKEEVISKKESKFKSYLSFTKFRISALVVVSALSGYLFVGGDNSLDIFYLLVGGVLVTAASNGSNQIIERELDILMKRTAGRPLPQGNMSVNEALILVVFCLITGTGRLLFGLSIRMAAVCGTFTSSRCPFGG